MFHSNNHIAAVKYPAYNDSIGINNVLRRRSMVTITQTKASDPSLPDDLDFSMSPSSSSEASYVTDSDSMIIVTQSCLKQVEALLKQRRDKGQKNESESGDEDNYFLRVFVDAGGCSGFQYQFEVDNELDDDEDFIVASIVEDNSSGTITRPRVVVDETSLEFLRGATIDYVIEMIKSSFVVVDNPQSESACGCGSSFAMKNFEKFGAKD